jgi:hypothetical protein
LVAPSAFAQHHGGGGGGHSRGGTVSRGAPVNRGGGAVYRGAVRGPAPRVYSGIRRGYPGVGRVVVPRYSVVAPIRFYRPYYSFRPRVSLGFGLWAGYPFGYSYAYYDPWYYPYGYVAPYGYPAYGAYPNYPPSAGYPSSYPAERNDPQDQEQDQNQDQNQEQNQDQNQNQNSVQPGPNGSQQNQANTGGVSFNLAPASAQLFIDGAMVGTVGQFTPTTQPLGLAAGRHHVEIQASGYQTMAFNVDILPGQVIPYQGEMERR